MITLTWWQLLLIPAVIGYVWGMYKFRDLGLGGSLFWPVFFILWALFGHIQ